MTYPPGDGARRSRRGYAYQDAVTLLDCLDMHNGHYEEVSFEDLDDIVCRGHDFTKYRQVKTKEDAVQHSIATICKPKLKNKPETSILGRLFSSKPISESTGFCLLLNETPHSNLATFRVRRGRSRGKVAEESCREIIGRLDGLILPHGITVSWCVDRFEILIESRTIDEIEDRLWRRLIGPVTKILHMQPIPSELEDILVILGRRLTRDARAFTPQAWTATDFDLMLKEAVAKCTGINVDGTRIPLPTLATKLAPTKISEPEIQAQSAAMLDYRRRYRSAIGEERSIFKNINDHIFFACVEVSARRRAGFIPDGPVAYAETIHAIKHLNIPGVSVSLPDKLAALTDVTARCQHRYSDDS